MGLRGLNIYAMIWVAQRRGMDGVNTLRRILDRMVGLSAGSRRRGS